MMQSVWKMLLVVFCFVAVPVQAAIVEYDLTIAEEQINITGRPATAITVNGSIPGPVLRFTEGDIARIRVHNTLVVETSIHWHGLLLPPGMDGVPLISFPPIAPGTTFVYEFPLRQHGTYWYHSHSGMQEQSGHYGALVIAPREEQQTERDVVLLFSDWTDESPGEVHRTLKRGSEWYALKKGSAQSLLGAARLHMLGPYFERELQRMPAMDIADVAYDRFLVNGQTEMSLTAAPAETLRLRIVDGSATTFFYLEFAGGPMRIVAADGQDVEPIDEQRLLIGVAETYDLLITVPADGAYEFRATAHDGSGHTSFWIGSGKRHAAPDIPRPNLYAAMGSPSLEKVFALTPQGVMGMPDRAVAAGKFDQPGMMEMAGMAGHVMDGAAMSADAHAGMVMDSGAVQPHNDHAMVEMAEPEPVHRHGEEQGKPQKRVFNLLAEDVAASSDLALDGMDAARPWPPYTRLRATRPTSLDASKPVREIRLTLDGDMKRYVWLLNNQALSEADDIRIKEGEVVRFIMINRTMMHHPMHLHGHFFRVINGQGDYSPLKHTVNVAPMSTTIIEFDANEVGDWFFHCHLLYHMDSGMARLVHYENFLPDADVMAIRPQLYADHWYFWGEADLLSNMTEGYLRTANTRNILTAAWETGWQEVDGTESEFHLTWDRSVNGFFSLFIGAELGDAVEEERGVLGIRYLLPLGVECTSFLGSDGHAGVVAEKEFQLTPRLSLDGQAQYESGGEWESLAGLSYTLNKAFSLRVQWHSEYGLGGGVQARF